MRDSLDLTKTVLMGKTINRMYWKTVLQAMAVYAILLVVIVLLSLVFEHWLDNQGAEGTLEGTLPLTILRAIGALGPYFIALAFWQTAIVSINSDHLKVAQQTLVQFIPDLRRQNKVKSEETPETNRKGTNIKRRLLFVAFWGIVIFTDGVDRVLWGLGILILAMVVYTLYQQFERPESDTPVNSRQIPPASPMWRFWLFAAFILIVIPFTLLLERPFHDILIFNFALVVYHVILIFASTYLSKNPYAYIYDTALAEGDYQGALDMLDSLEEGRIGQADMLVLKGVILLRMARPDTAKDVFYEAMRTSFNLSAPAIAIAMLDYGAALFYQGQFDAGLPYLEASVRLMPSLSSTYRTLMLYYFEQQIEPERTLEISRAMMNFAVPQRFTNMQQRIRLAWAWAYHAHALVWNGHYDEADQFMAQAFDTLDSHLKPWQAVLHNSAGLIAKIKADHAGARTHFDQAIALDPDGYEGQRAHRYLEALPIA